MIMVKHDINNDNDNNNNDNKIMGMTNIIIPYFFVFHAFFK